MYIISYIKVVYDYVLKNNNLEKTIQIKNATAYIELSNKPDFQEHFMDSMMFEYV